MTLLADCCCYYCIQLEAVQVTVSAIEKALKIVSDSFIDRSLICYMSFYMDMLLYTI